MPPYSIGLCLTPWTSRTDVVYSGRPQASLVLPPSQPCYATRPAPALPLAPVGHMRHAEHLIIAYSAKLVTYHAYCHRLRLAPPPAPTAIMPRRATCCHVRPCPPCIFDNVPATATASSAV